MVASGTFGYAKEFEEFVRLDKLGAIITKTITLKKRDGNPMPRLCETASGMLNSIGLQNEGIDDFLGEKLTYLSGIKAPLIVSISGDSVGEFCELAERLDKIKRIDGIELNISCPNIKRAESTLYHSLRSGTGQEEHPVPLTSFGYGAGRAKSGSQMLEIVAQDKAATYEVVKHVRKLTDKTLITKLSPNVTNVVEIAEAACRAGTDAVSLVNTFFGMAIDIETKTSRLGNITGGLSGPCIKPIAVKMVWEVAKNIKKPVIGIGGIMGAGDALEFLIAGAKAVQIGTANFIQPDISEKIIKGLEDYLKINKIEYYGFNRHF